MLFHTFQWQCLLGQSITTSHLDRTVFKITLSHSQTYRNSLQLVIGKFPTRLLRVTIIKFHADSRSFQFIHQTANRLTDFLQSFQTFIDRHDSHLKWS